MYIHTHMHTYICKCMCSSSIHDVLEHCRNPSFAFCTASRTKHYPCTPENLHRRCEKGVFIGCCHLEEGPFSVSMLVVRSVTFITSAADGMDPESSQVLVQPPKFVLKLIYVFMYTFMYIYTYVPTRVCTYVCIFMYAYLYGDFCKPYLSYSFFLLMIR